MSIIFASIVGLFLAFFPTAMVVYFKRGTGVTITVLILNIIGFFTLGLTTIIAWIIAAISIGLVNTLKSIAFTVFLILLALALGVGEIAFVANLMGAL